MKKTFRKLAAAATGVLLSLAGCGGDSKRTEICR